MIRRRPWTTAATAIAATAAVIVWRIRRTIRWRPAVARVQKVVARPEAARRVEEPSPAVASEPVTDDATDVTDLAAAADITASSEPASALRVFVATEPAVAEPVIDLDLIAQDLEGVAAALARLDDGTYWTDEVTGEPLVEELLVADPVARRNR